MLKGTCATLPRTESNTNPVPFNKTFNSRVVQHEKGEEKIIIKVKTNKMDTLGGGNRA